MGPTMQTITQSDFRRVRLTDAEMARQAAEREQAQRLANLREAQEGYVIETRRACVGTAGEYGRMLMDRDLDMLIEAGKAIGKAAKALARTADNAQFVSAIIKAVPTAERMFESIDDALPAHAWMVVAAAAEVEAAG